MFAEASQIVLTISCLVTLRLQTLRFQPSKLLVLYLSWFCLPRAPFLFSGSHSLAIYSEYVFQVTTLPPSACFVGGCVSIAQRLAQAVAVFQVGLSVLLP